METILNQLNPVIALVLGFAVGMVTTLLCLVLGMAWAPKMPLAPKLPEPPALGRSRLLQHQMHTRR